MNVWKIENDLHRQQMDYHNTQERGMEIERQRRLQALGVLAAQQHLRTISGECEEPGCSHYAEEGTPFCVGHTPFDLLDEEGDAERRRREKLVKV